MGKSIQRNTGLLTFGSVADMRAFVGGSGLKNGETVYLHDSTNPGNWEWSTSSSATDDGVDVVKITSWSGAGRFLRLKPNAENVTANDYQTQADVNSERISVKAYGAVGDGVTDDSAAIQAAFDYAESATSINTISIYFPRGTYIVNSPLTLQVSGNHIRIYGTGKRGTTIKAGASMSQILTIGQSSGVYQLMEVDRIRFDCNSLASCGIDATYLRYSTIHDCEFAGATGGNFMLKISRWINRVYLNTFNSSGTGSGLLMPDETINDFTLWGNSFTDLEVGVKVLNISHDLKIENNTFDVCTAAGVFLANGGRNVIIRGNYFERCGGLDSAGVDIPADGGGTAKYSGAIVGTSDGINAITLIENLVVQDNQFANCNASSLGLFSGITGLDWRNNSALRGYSYDYVVRFVENATGDENSANTRMVVQQRDIGGQFTELVELAGGSASLDHCGLQLMWDKEDVRTLTFPVRDLIPTNLTSSLYSVDAGSVAQNGYYEGLHPIWEFSSSGDITLTITLDSTSAWKGRYFRVNFLTRGAASDNGVWFRYYVNTGAGLLLDFSESRTSNSTWTTSCRNSTLYCPLDATQIRFRFNQVNGGTASQITALTVDSASEPIRR